MNLNKKVVTIIDEATSTGDSAIISISDEELITLEVTGSATDFSLDLLGEINENYLPVGSINKADFSTGSTLTVLDRLYVVDVTGLKSFKATITAITGGDLSVVVRQTTSRG